ncbi:hypothetical protein LMTR3_25100 [Bradyrhizobium sp. LMTR 3]|nr:hypothetical protein LMTR3_25100 [Bradyrhizobium sp. LMTR 3]
MVLATIADSDATMAERQIERCDLSNQHACSLEVTTQRSIAVQRSTSGPSIEAVAPVSAQSSRLQPLIRIPLSRARIS